jgi:hypothetical protein
MVVVKREESLLLLDCPFDEKLDRFPPLFTIYRLPSDLEARRRMAGVTLVLLEGFMILGALGDPADRGTTVWRSPKG